MHETTVTWQSLQTLLRRRLHELKDKKTGETGEWRKLEQESKGQITYRWIRTFAAGLYPETSPTRVLTLAAALGFPVKMTIPWRQSLATRTKGRG